MIKLTCNSEIRTTKKRPLDPPESESEDEVATEDDKPKRKQRKKEANKPKTKTTEKTNKRSTKASPTKLTREHVIEISDKPVVSNERILERMERQHQETVQLVHASQKQTASTMQEQLEEIRAEIRDPIVGIIKWV
jgi:hypothetical protein